MKILLEHETEYLLQNCSCYHDLDDGKYDMLCSGEVYFAFNELESLDGTTTIDAPSIGIESREEELNFLIDPDHEGSASDNIETSLREYYWYV